MRTLPPENVALSHASSDATNTPIEYWADDSDEEDDFDIDNDGFDDTEVAWYGNITGHERRKGDAW